MQAYPNRSRNFVRIVEHATGNEGNAKLDSVLWTALHLHVVIDNANATSLKM